MKAALTVWDGRVAPVFDVSRGAVILTIENGVEGTRHTENIEAPTASLKIERLIELGVETLICGAISQPLHQKLTSRGVRVIGFVAGKIDKVVSAFIAGTLPTPSLSMPGCCGRQLRFRGERGKGGGRCEGWGRKADQS